MRVFGIERPEDVTPNDRRNAKAVNFGVVYGISVTLVYPQPRYQP